jgi:hypothetical protein
MATGMAVQPLTSFETPKLDETFCLARLPRLSYDTGVKTLTIRLPDVLAKHIEEESKSRRVSKSDIVRERLAATPPAGTVHPLADILAEIDALPAPGRKRNSVRDKKRLPEIIRAHYRAAKRHY